MTLLGTLGWGKCILHVRGMWVTGVKVLDCGKQILTHLSLIPISRYSHTFIISCLRCWKDPLFASNQQNAKGNLRSVPWLLHIMLDWALLADLFFLSHVGFEEAFLCMWEGLVAGKCGCLYEWERLPTGSQKEAVGLNFTAARKWILSSTKVNLEVDLLQVNSYLLSVENWALAELWLCLAEKPAKTC